MTNFSIPLGPIQPHGDEHPDHTQRNAITGMTQKIHYVKTCDNQSLQAIDLNDFDLDAG